MDENGDLGQTTSDESLILLARAGDRSAFGELWQRHARSGLRVAKQFTSSLDADDLVSEAYVRIYQRVLAGGGPDGAFRPYLYTTIRNLASRLGQSRHEVQVEDIGEFEDPAFNDDSASIALDRTLTARAFKSLPERWQAVLWYTEVEGMDPHEVAPILGISANGVAALSYRAREGLRKAWLQAHISDATAEGECRWTIARLGDYVRDGLTEREHERVSDHLRGCAKCSIISEEVDEVGSRLALVMLPILLGAAAGGTLLASLAAPGSATAASLVTPAVPHALHAVGAAAAVAAAPAVAAGLSATASTALVGTLVAAIAVTGGLAVGVGATAPQADHQQVSVSQPQIEPQPTPSGAGSKADPNGNTSGDQSAVSNTLDVAGDAATSAANGAAGGATSAVSNGLNSASSSLVNSLNGATGGATDLLQDLTNPLNTIIPTLPIHPGDVPAHDAPDGIVGATASLDLSGKGMPGAHVSIQAAGVVYATTVISPQGTWAVHISALPSSADVLQVRQTLVNILGLHLLSVPLSILSNTLGITIDLLN